MRHRAVSSKWGRSTAHRRALLAALVCGLIDAKRITTTLAKAKGARPLAERLVTWAKRGTLADRRRALAVLRRPAAVRRLFVDIAPQCRDRQGGYTRIVKLHRRGGDHAPLALLEWLSIAPVDQRKKPAPKAGETPNAPAAGA